MRERADRGGCWMDSSALVIGEIGVDCFAGELLMRFLSAVVLGFHTVQDWLRGGHKARKDSLYDVQAFSRVNMIAIGTANS